MDCYWNYYSRVFVVEVDLVVRESSAVAVAVGCLAARIAAVGVATAVASCRWHWYQFGRPFVVEVTTDWVVLYWKSFGSLNTMPIDMLDFRNYV